MQHMQIPLNRNKSEPMYLRVVQSIKQQISAGKSGSVLPSIRTMAERHGVSKTMVSMGYAELGACGLVEGRIGQVTVVSAPSKASTQPLYLLPELSSTTELYLDANHAGVTFAPGKVFFAGNAPSNYLRISYGAEAPKRIEHGISLLAELIQKHMNR